MGRPRASGHLARTSSRRLASGSAEGDAELIQDTRGQPATQGGRWAGQLGGEGRQRTRRWNPRLSQLCVHDNYRDNPFHNFRHCFCVTQMMYSMVWLCRLQVGRWGLLRGGHPRDTAPTWGHRLPRPPGPTPQASSQGASSRPCHSSPPIPAPSSPPPTLSLIQEKFSQMDILILMTAAVCHDLDHPGYNNTYVHNFSLFFLLMGSLVIRVTFSA